MERSRRLRRLGPVLAATELVVLGFVPRLEPTSAPAVVCWCGSRMLLGGDLTGLDELVA